MKLLKEFNVITIPNKNSDEKDFYIEGIFLQAEKPNRNGRIYPKHVLEDEVRKYQTKILERSSVGELGHPDTPTINLDRTSHLITELRFDGNNVYGKAKILDTPYGNIVKSFIKEGIKLGVSSRGVGSVKTNRNGLDEVQGDFILSTIDIVQNPSAPDAYVRGLMENVEWVRDNEGNWKPSYYKKAEALNEEKLLEKFAEFLKNIQIYK